MRHKKADDWFPFWIDKWFFGSTKLEFSPAERSVWIDLIALSKKDSGFIRANVGVPYPRKQLAGLFVVPLNLLNKTIDKSIQSKKLEQLEDGTLFVLSTKKYAISDRHKRRLEAAIMAENKDIVAEITALNIEKNIDTIREEKRTPPTPSFFSLEEVKSACILNGIPESNAQSYFDQYNSQGWKKANDQLITNLQSHIAKRWSKEKQCWDFDESSGGADKSFGKCCYYHGSTACCETGTGPTKFVWRENKPFGRVNCYDQWVKRGRLEK